MNNSFLDQMGIKPMSIQNTRPRSGPEASRSNYQHESVINLISSKSGDEKQFMVRMGVRNEGSRKSYILWGHMIGKNMNPYHYGEDDYVSVVAMEISDANPDQANWYSGGTQKDRAFDTKEGETFKYRNRVFTRLTKDELAKFEGETYKEMVP